MSVCGAIWRRNGFQVFKDGHVVGKNELTQVLGDHLGRLPANDFKTGWRNVADHVVSANTAQDVGTVFCKELVIDLVRASQLVLGFRRNKASLL